MGTTLTGKRVQNTYDSLLKLSDNDNLTGVAKIIGDGLGNDSPLYLSTSKIGVGVSPTYQFQTSGDAKFGGSLIIAGDLTVNGSTTHISSTIVEIGDNMIEMAKDNVSNTMDIGWYGTIVESGTKYVGVFYDASSGVTTPEFHIGLGTVEPSSTASWTTKGKLVIGALDATTGVFSGQVTIPQTPSADTDAASKGYVDDSIESGSVEVAKRIEITVKNISGGSLSKGTIVHASPSVSPPSGNVVEVIAADYDDATKMPGIGILNETIANEAEGAAVMIGAVRGINTSSFSTGDELFVGNNGAFTNTKPTANNEFIQKIAIVLKVHASNGSIKVFGAGRANDVPNQISRNVNFTDNSKLTFGDSTTPDFQIYHDGSNSYINEDGTGVLAIQSNGTEVQINKGATEYMARFITDGAVELYYDNSKKFETTSGGISVTGLGQFSNKILVADGSVSAPSYSFTNDTDTGIYHSGTQLKFALAGSDKITISNSQTTIEDTLIVNDHISADDKVIIEGNTNPHLEIQDITNERYTRLYSGDSESVLSYTNPTFSLRTGEFNGTVVFSVDSSRNVTFNNNVLPDVDSANDLGSTSLRWANVWADNINGGTPVNGGGTANDVVMWSDSDTLTDAPIAISGNNATFAGSVSISHQSGDTLTLTKGTTEPSLRLEGDTNKDFVITVSGELLTFTQNDGATDILTLDHDTKNATFAGTITSGAHLINASSSAFGGSSVQGVNTDFLVDTGQGYARINSYHTGGSNIQFLTNAASSTTNSVVLELSKDNLATFYGGLITNDYLRLQGQADANIYLQSSTASTSLWNIKARSDDYFLIGRVGVQNDFFISNIGNAHFAASVGIGITSTPPSPLTVVGTGVGASGTIGIQGANAHVGFKNSSGTFRSWVGHFNAANHGSDADLNLKTGYGTTGNIRFSADGDTTAAQMFLQGSSGNFGIGTGTSPNAKLDVQSTSSDVAFFRSSQATTTNVYITNTNATTNNTANLYFAPANNIAGSYIRATAIEDFTTSANRTSDLRFAVRKDGTFNEAVIIDSSGNLGIGVTPEAWTVFNPVLRVGDGGSLTGTGTSNFRMFANTYYDGSYKRIGSGTATQYEQDGYHAWLIAASGTANSTISWSEGMRLTSTGLGIGTTSPFSGNKLDVRGGNIMVGGFGGGTDYGLILTPDDGSGYWNIANVTGGALTFNNSATIGSSEQMRLTTTGLGIGGTPSTFANFTNVTIQGGSSGSNLDFKNSIGTRVGAIVSTPSLLSVETNTSTPVIFKTNDTERMRITSSGELQVTGNGVIKNQESGGNFSYLQQTSSDSRLFVQYSQPLLFGTNATERMRIDSSGNSTFAGNVLISSNGDATQLQIRRASASQDNGLQLQDQNGNKHAIFNLEGSVTNNLQIASTQQILFHTSSDCANPPTSERMRITGQGRLGLGTTSPSNLIHIYNTASADVGLIESTQVFSTLAFKSSTNSSTVTIGIDGAGNAAMENKLSSGGLNLVTNGSTRLSINSSGDILLGGITTVGNTHASFDSASNDRMIFNIGSSTTSSIDIINFRNPNGIVGGINTDGFTTSFSSSSDYRLKENVVKLTNALDKVSELKPSRFNFINEEKTVNGFLAHEVENIVPEAISGTKDQVDEKGNPVYQRIDQSKLIPLLVGAIQELKEEIEILRSQINS